MDIATLDPGALFKADGVYAVKSEYHLSSGPCECILLASGEFAYFSQGDETRVQEVIDLAQLRAEIARLREERDTAIAQRNARDWEQAALRAALLFLWDRMALDKDGGSVHLTYAELDQVSVSMIDKQIAARAEGG